MSIDRIRPGQMYHLVSSEVYGASLCALGHLEQARADLEYALAAIESRSVPDSAELAEVLVNLANVLLDIGLADMAEEAMLRALDIEQEGSQAAVETLANLGNIAMAREQPALAIGRYNDALDAMLPHHGTGHPKVLRLASNLGNAIRLSGQFEAAEEHLRRVLSAQHAELGAPHPDLATSRANLALALAEQGQLSEAEQLILESLEQLRDTAPDHHHVSYSEWVLEELRRLRPPMD